MFLRGKSRNRFALGQRDWAGGGGPPGGHVAGDTSRVTEGRLPLSKTQANAAPSLSEAELDRAVNEGISRHRGDKPIEVLCGGSELMQGNVASTPQHQAALGPRGAELRHGSARGASRRERPGYVDQHGAAFVLKGGAPADGVPHSFGVVGTFVTQRRCWANPCVFRALWEARCGRMGMQAPQRRV